MKILVLGKTGMLGHVVYTYFKEHYYEVFATSRKEDADNYFDAEKNINSIIPLIEKIKPDVIINCIGILNKDAEEHQAKATLINSYLPHFLDELSEKYKYKFIHVTTDCVFDGKKGEYHEDSIKDATSFYGQSKALGEINNNRSLTLRTSIVGPDINENGIGLFNWFMNQENEVGGFTKVNWTGITTLEFAKQMEKAIQNNLTGLRHVVNGESIPKYNLLELFAKYFEKNIQINKNDDIESNKTLVKSEKDFDFEVPSYEKMISDMKLWVDNHQNLYLNYTKSKSEK